MYKILRYTAFFLKRPVNQIISKTVRIEANDKNEEKNHRNQFPQTTIIYSGRIKEKGADDINTDINNSAANGSSRKISLLNESTLGLN
jgi:hypothetical protein